MVGVNMSDKLQEHLEWVNQVVEQEKNKFKGDELNDLKKQLAEQQRLIERLVEKS